MLNLNEVLYTMHSITELPVWEQLFKRIVWDQLGDQFVDLQGLRILDFGSGEGVTANHFAEKNGVTAIEPSEEMLKSAWMDFPYEQRVGDVRSLCDYPANTFDLIICHNVLEYIEDKEQVIRELERVLKKDGILSIVKHNRAGRVMQMAVLLNDFDRAHALLDGQNSSAARFGTIRYYEDSDLLTWGLNLRTKQIFGIRTFWDLQQNQEIQKQEDWQENMIALERRVEQIPEFRDIAFFHHIVLSKK